MSEPNGIVTLVMGVAACGKSALGLALAQALQCQFLEGDEYHPETNVAKMSAGIALTDSDRWPWLHNLCDATNLALESTDDGAPLVVMSCSALKQSYRRLLRDHMRATVRFVWLDVDTPELQRRIEQRSGHYMPPELLASQLQTLEPPVAEPQVLRLEIGSVDELVTQVLAHWAKDDQ